MKGNGRKHYTKMCEHDWVGQTKGHESKLKGMEKVMPSGGNLKLGGCKMRQADGNNWLQNE